MPFAKRGLRRLHYEVHGRAEAPPLLLIMGMGFSSRAWERLPARLGERFRVIVFDNPGTGRSSMPLPPLRIRHMADDAAVVLTAAGADDAFVFGISMGGMIAMELVLRHPERVRALVLGATFGSWISSVKPPPALVRDLLLGALFRPRDKVARLSRILVSPEFLTDGGGAFAAWLGAAEPVTPVMAAGQAVAITLHAAGSRLATIRTPTLVLSGDVDRLVPVENSRRLARRIPGARLVELPGAGHCFPLERPGETASVVTRFFLPDADAPARRTGLP